MRSVICWFSMIYLKLLLLQNAINYPIRIQMHSQPYIDGCVEILDNRIKWMTMINITLITEIWFIKENVVPDYVAKCNIRRKITRQIWIMNTSKSAHITRIKYKNLTERMVQLHLLWESREFRTPIQNLYRVIRILVQGCSRKILSNIWKQLKAGTILTWNTLTLKTFSGSVCSNRI